MSTNKEQSCVAKSGLIANLEFDYSLEKEPYMYIAGHNSGPVKSKSFKIVSNECTYHGYIIFDDFYRGFYNKSIGIYVNNVQEIIMKYDFLINGFKHKGLLDGIDCVNFNDNPMGNRFELTIESYIESDIENEFKRFKFKTFKGKLEIMMKPKYSITEFKPT